MRRQTLCGIKRTQTSLFAVGIAVSGSSFAQQAPAELPAASHPELAEIVVTARRIEERLQDIPVAVTAVTQAQLDNAGIRTVADLPLLTPGLQTGASPYDTTNVVFKIRGQSQSAGQLEDSVGVYVDGVYYPKTFGLGGALFDLERIEVLKGPQGTLYGKNTSGGAVSIITRKPELNDTGGFLDVQGGFYDPHSSPAATGKGAVNIPLVQDKLALRIAGSYDYSDGYGRNGNDRHLLNRDDGYLRAALRYDPVDSLSMLLSADYARFRNNGVLFRVVEATPGVASLEANLAAGQGPQFGGVGLAAVGADLRTPSYYQGSETGPSYDSINHYGTSLTVNYDISGATHLKSISAFRRLERLSAGDQDGSQYPIFETTTGERSNFFSQEVDLDGKVLNSNLDYLTGLYYSHFKNTQVNPTGNLILPILTADPALGPSRNVYDNVDTTTSYGAFAHGVYHFTEQFNVTGGLRYSLDQRKFIDQSYSYFLSNGQRTCNFAAYGATLANNCLLDFSKLGTNPGPVGPGNPALGSLSDGDVSYEFALTYLPTRNMTVYATTRRGFRSGDWNPVGAVPNKFKPEIATDFEVGVKSMLLDRTLTMNIAAYQTNYSDIQKTEVTAPGITQIQNAAKATIRGVELELLAQPLEYLQLGANYTYTHARYKSYEDGGKDYSSEPFDVSPNVVTLNGQLTIPVRPEADLVLSADVAAYEKRYFSQSSHLLNISTDPVLVQSGYTVVNGRIAYRMKSANAEVAFFGRNLLNKSYYVDGTELRAAGLVINFPGEPRFLGIELVKRFGGE
jgi:iron complex outermembrane receptor protein